MKRKSCGQATADPASLWVSLAANGDRHAAYRAHPAKDRTHNEIPFGQMSVTFAGLL